MKALVIDDDVTARQNLKGLLLGAEIGFIWAADGANGLRLFYKEQPDLVVLNLELSDLSGWKILVAIRELSEVPVLGLCSGGEMEKVRGLRSGADDVMTKPVGRQEMLARIESLLRWRTSNEQAPSILADGCLRIDRRAHRVEVLGVEVELTPTEFRLLAAFADHPGQALTHCQLMEMAWGDGHREKGEVKLYVGYLRRKLADAALINPVETVRGIGYRYQPHHLASPDAPTPVSSSFQPDQRLAVPTSTA